MQLVNMVGDDLERQESDIRTLKRSVLGSPPCFSVEFPNRTRTRFLLSNDMLHALWQA